MSILKNLITSNLSRSVTRHSIRPLSFWSTTPSFPTPVSNPRIPMREAITAPIPTTLADHEFLTDVAAYTWNLRNRSRRGVPYFWGDMQICFDAYHRDGIVKIQDSSAYTIKTVITTKEYMQLYIRCTFEDIQKVFMYLRSKNIGVAVGDYSGHPSHSPSTGFIRLSGLDVSNTPCITLRTDASLLGDFGGYGYIFSDSADNYLDWNYGTKDYIAPELTLAEQRVTVLELYAILKALESPVYIEELQTNSKLRILTDCYHAVQIIQGKPVVANMAAGVTNKYYSYVMDLMCSIGYEIKPLYDYSPSHIYRELNGDCDFLARMGRIQRRHPTFQEVYNCRESERVRLYYPSPPSVPPTSSTVPPTSSPSPGLVI